MNITYLLNCSAKLLRFSVSVYRIHPSLSLVDYLKFLNTCRWLISWIGRRVPQVPNVMPWSSASTSRNASNACKRYIEHYHWISSTTHDDLYFEKTAIFPRYPTSCLGRPVSRSITHHTTVKVKKNIIIDYNNCQLLVISTGRVTHVTNVLPWLTASIHIPSRLKCL